jgi:hypothetical protein
VDDSGTVLLVVLGGDPGQGEVISEVMYGGQDGGIYPDSILPVSGGNHADLLAVGGKGDDLGFESVGEALVHGGAAGKDYVLAKILPHINVGGGHGGPGEVLEGHPGYAVILFVLKYALKCFCIYTDFGLEEELGAGHADMGGHGDDTFVGHGVLLVVLGRVLGLTVLLLVVLGDVAKLFLDVAGNFKLDVRGEIHIGFVEELLHPGGEGVAGDLHLLDGVGDTVTSIDDETGGPAGGVEGHDSLEGDEDFLYLEGLEQNGDHLLAVGLGVARDLGQEDAEGLLRGNTELLVESVVPNLFHVYPGLNDTSGDGVLKV